MKESNLRPSRHQHNALSNWANGQLYASTENLYPLVSENDITAVPGHTVSWNLILLYEILMKSAEQIVGENWQGY